MSIIVLISLQPIRKRFYEFFYLTHVLLVMYVLSIKLFAYDVNADVLALQDFTYPFYYSLRLRKPTVSV